MAVIEKLLQKFEDRPEVLCYREIEKILFHLGFQKSQGKTSHVKFSHPKCPQVLIFSVHNRDCKKAYKTTTLKILLEYKFL